MGSTALGLFRRVKLQLDSGKNSERVFPLPFYTAAPRLLSFQVKIDITTA